MEKPTHKNTHLQTAQCQPATQSLQESIFSPNPTVIKNKKSPFPQKNKTYNTDRQRYIDNEEEALGGNRVDGPARNLTECASHTTYVRVSYTAVRRLTG